MRRYQRSAEMYPLVLAWKKSGETQSKFCERKGLSPSVLSYWYKRYKADEQPSISSAFTEIRPEAATPIEIQYPNGVKINLPKNSSLSIIRSLIELV